MPKTPSKILADLLSKEQVELLDIYHRKDGDIIRVKDKLSGKVDLYVSKTHVRDIVSEEDLAKIASKIITKIRSK